MSGCLILAVRPKMLETPLGGLDKMYRLHKWLGIIALSGSILHWTCKQFPKWLIELGLIDGKRPPRPPMQEILTLKDWLATQRHFAEEVGEIAFYVALVLLVAALIKRIPYRWFAKLHILDLLRKYPEDLQFPNEIRKPNPKKRQGIQTAHRCNARPFS